MRRVSSRQRLVSWDAFDATAEDDSSLSDYETCCQDRKLSSASLVTLDSTSNNNNNNKRKRRVKEEPLAASTQSTLSSSLGEVHPIAALPWEINTPSIASELSLLMDDAQLHILSFLNVQDVRHMMRVNHDQRSLIVSDEAEGLWKDLAHQEWTWMRNRTTALLQDDLHDNSSSNINMLLSLACPTPSQVDESLFTPPARTLRSRRIVTRPTLLKTVQTENGPAAVQFVGPIGQGNQSIRANLPMPRPKLLPQNSTKSTPSLMSRLRCAYLQEEPERYSTTTWRPFVAPFCMDDSVMNMTPRLVSYYEVSILPAPTPTTTTNTSFQTRPTNSTNASGCVAVGLALPDFSLHTRMPGWDLASYGYHGDDGGIFHAKGHMLKQYGPMYGVGDVIGCGIDYHQRAIFFTRNGEFLGHAFEDLDTTLLTQDLYPVVGMDTNCLVQSNFGTDRPFSFDLQSYMEKQKDVVLQSLQ